MPRSQTANDSRANESHGAHAGKKKSRRSSARKKSQISPAAETRAKAAVPTAGRRPATKQPRLNRDMASPLGDAVAKARDLARAGQHGKVIDHCSHALASSGQESGSLAAEQMHLLDL